MDDPMKGASTGWREDACLMFLQGLCGLVLGFLIASILAAIAMPSFESIVMSHDMARDLERLALICSLLDLPRWLTLLMFLAAGGASWVMTARRLNPHLPAFPFLDGPRPGLAWAATAASAGAFLAGLAVVQNRAPAEGGALDLLGLCATAAGGAFAWLILSPAGLGGDLRSWPWSRREDASETRQPGSRLAAAGLGALFGLLAGFLLNAAGRTFSFLFHWILEVGCPSFEVNVSQGLVVYTLPLALSTGFFAAAFGLVPAFAADGSALSSRLRRAVLPAALLAAAGLWLHGLHSRAVANNHWRAAGLLQAAALPDSKPPAWTLVVLGADGRPAPTVQPWPVEAKSLHSADAVPATEANARALEAFLAGPGRDSRFRRAAADALPRLRRVLWDRDAGRRAAEIVAYVFGEGFLERAFEIAWLADSAPVTPANRARLERLSDPDRFRIRGRAALKIARAWHRFGDAARVRHWLDVARLSPLPEDEKAPPEGIAFAGGSVQGRLAVDGVSPAGTRVGLFRLADDGRVFTPPTPAYPGVGMADARTLGADGTFGFEGLTEGRYGLCLLLPPGALPAGAALKSPRLPGVFEVSRRAPRATLGLTALSAGR